MPRIRNLRLAPRLHTQDEAGKQVEETEHLRVPEVPLEEAVHEKSHEDGRIRMDQPFLPEIADLAVRRGPMGEAEEELAAMRASPQPGRPGIADGP